MDISNADLVPDLTCLPEKAIEEISLEGLDGCTDRESRVPGSI